MDEIINGLGSFDGVWRRIEDADSGAPESRLREYIAGEARSAAAYVHLKSTVCGFSRVFTSMERDERRHLARLQLEYFLLTGDSVTPEPCAPPSGGALSLLRECFLAKKATAAEYASAAKAFPQLRALFDNMSSDELRHAETLRSIIAGMLR